MASLDIVVTKVRRIEAHLLREISSSMCEEALNLISEGFRSGTDPYGKPWNAPNNLQITGRIRAYAKSEEAAVGFEVHATDEKAIWHHDPQPREAWGGKALPTRLQVPVGGNLPGEWEIRLREAAEDALEELAR
jgi:hypothetical protein